MKILIDKSFEKDTDEITDKKILKSVAHCIKEIQTIDKLSAISNCKKLKGSKTACRINIGKYRIGFIFENQNFKI